ELLLVHALRERRAHPCERHVFTALGMGMNGHRRVRELVDERPRRQIGRRGGAEERQEQEKRGEGELGAAHVRDASIALAGPLSLDWMTGAAGDGDAMAQGAVRAQRKPVPSYVSPLSIA